MKLCNKCGKANSLSAYARRGPNSELRRGACRKCLKAKRAAYYQTRKDVVRAKDLLRKYGMSLEQRQQMFADQNGRCAICQSRLDNGKLTHVDHDHQSNKVRALLCSCCNHAVGKVKEDILIARSLVAYLEKHKV